MRIYFELSTCDSKDEAAIKVLFCEKWRYKIMWHLAELHDQIEADEENGVILVSKQETFRIEVRGFSDELRDEIQEKLAQVIIGYRAQTGRLQQLNLTDKILSEAAL